MSNRLVKPTIIVMVGTGVSLVLSFARQVGLAGLFGATATTDAYMIAFFIPNQLQSFLIAGVLTVAFIPIFVESLAKEETAKSQQLVNTVINLVLISFILITVIGVAGAPWLVRLIAPGFVGVTRDLVITLTRIMFPVVIGTGLAGVLGGILNSYQRFAAPAFTSAVFNLVFLGSLFTLGRWFGIVGVALGTLMASLCQVVIQIPSLSRAGFRYQMVLDLHHSALTKIVKLATPLFLRLVVVQVYLVVLRILASQLPEGSVSAFEYAQRVSLAPAQALGAAIPIVLFPTLSMQAARMESDKFLDSLSNGINKLLLLLVPVSVLMMVLATPLVRVLFQRGAFDAGATSLTAHSLLFFSTGLFAYPVLWLLNRAFFALQDTLIPLMVASVCSLLAIGLGVVLVPYLGVAALALSYSVSAILQAVALLGAVKGTIPSLEMGLLFRRSQKVMTAGLAMAPVCWLLAHQLGLFGGGLRVGLEILYLAASSLTALAIYVFVLLILRNEEALSIWNIAIREPAAKYIRALNNVRNTKI